MGDVVWEVATRETWESAADIFNTESGACRLAVRLYWRLREAERLVASARMQGGASPEHPGKR